MLHTCFFVFATDNMPVEMPLTDEDRATLERWEGMQHQQQHGVSNQLPCFSTVSTASSDITTTVTTTTTITTTTTTAGDTGALQLNSSDSRLANKYLADTDEMWSPLTNLSSADIASCLQTTAAATTATVTAGALQLSSADSRLADSYLANTGAIWRPLISLSSADITGCLQTTAAGVDDDDAAAITRQRSCAGYGVGEIIPSLSDKYVLSFHCMHWHWSVISVNSLSVLHLFIYCGDFLGR